MNKNKSIGILILIGITFQSIITQAQVKVGNNPTTLNSSAVLELESTTQGLLLPRMTTTQRNAIANPATGLVIYNTTTSNAEVNIGSSSSPIWQVASLTSGTNGQTLRHDGTKWIANSTLFNNGTNVGIGTTTPASGLDINTSMGLSVTTLTAATTLNQSHNVVLCNNGPYTVSLPTATNNMGKVYYVKNITTNRQPIYIDAFGTQTIDQNLVYTLNTFNFAIRIVCDGVNWHVLETSGEILTSFKLKNCDGSLFTWFDVVSPTGRIWMDRNLGARRVATSSTDTNSYGDLYQWGRLNDGHQCRWSTTTTTLSTTNIPNNSNFIASTTAPQDWLSPQNSDLWRGVTGINNPCPSGYRVPTNAEWATEAASWSSLTITGAFASPLRFTLAGSRPNNGSFFGVNVWGMYWSSDVNGTGANRIQFNSATSGFSTGSFRPRADANSIRCIRD